MSKREILVVDDEQDIAELIVYMLRQEGYSVHLASSVDSALLTLTQFPVDVVLTDFMMPRLDGANLLRTMRANPQLASVPVLVLSALSEETVRRRCPGLAGFLRKPFHTADLLESVESFLKDIA